MFPWKDVNKNLAIIDMNIQVTISNRINYIYEHVHDTFGINGSVFWLVIHVVTTKFVKRYIYHAY